MKHIVTLKSSVIQGDASQENHYTYRNMRQVQFQENAEIPLEDIIEKQPYAATDTIMQNPENPEATSIPCART